MELQQQIQQMFSGSGARVIVHVFKLMEIAEMVVEEMGLKEHDTAFLVVMPTEVFNADSTIDPKVYEHHARELCQRLKNGEDTRPGTTAEVLIASMRVCTRTPVNSAFAGMVDWCFQEVFGEKALPGHKPRQDWPGQLTEDLSQARRKLSQDRGA